MGISHLGVQPEIDGVLNTLKRLFKQEEDHSRDDNPEYRLVPEYLRPTPRSVLGSRGHVGSRRIAVLASRTVPIGRDVVLRLTGHMAPRISRCPVIKLLAVLRLRSVYRLVIAPLRPPLLPHIGLLRMRCLFFLLRPSGCSAFGAEFFVRAELCSAFLTITGHLRSLPFYKLATAFVFNTEPRACRLSSKTATSAHFAGNRTRAPRSRQTCRETAARDRWQQAF